MDAWTVACIGGSWDGWLHSWPSWLDGCVFTSATGWAAGILGNGRGRMDERIAARWMRLCQLQERQMFCLR